MYLVQKLARAGAKTNNISSFHYLERGKGYSLNAIDNVPFDQIKEASGVYVLSAHIPKTNGVAGFFVENARKMHNVPVTLIKACDCDSMDHKADRIIEIKSHFAMFKAMNYYLLANGKQNNMFINGRTNGYEDYYQAIQKENYDALIAESGLSKDQIQSMANEMNNAMNAVFMYNEEDISSAAALEILNFMLITGKQGKTASGTVVLKTKNNSQGLRDMGICPKTGVGGRSLMESREDMQKLWGVSDLSDRVNYSIKEKLEKYEIKNLFIFGEDPAGTAKDEKAVNDLVFNTGFIVVADAFMSETAKAANLVLPLAFGFETGGSFTNTQKVIQRFEAALEAKTGVNNIELMNKLHGAFGLKTYESADEVFEEISKLLPESAENMFEFSITDGDNPRNMFDSGADYLANRFRKEFMSAFKN
jgi:formate dehydrogenase major subunit